MEGKEKVLVFTDCYIYGGSERLMSFLLNNNKINEKFYVKLSYRQYSAYDKGMLNDYSDVSSSSIFPQFLLSNDSIFHKINCSSIPKFFKIALKMPLFIMQKIQLYSIVNLVVFFFLLRKQKPNILHINNGGYPAARSCNLLVFANYLFWKAKVVYQVNNQAEKRKSFVDIFIDRFVSNHVHFFLTASKLAAQKLINNREFPETKIKTINNCVLPAVVVKNRQQICKDLGVVESSFILTQVGFLTERKGQKELISALSMLFKSKPELKSQISLLLVGNGEDDVKLKALCKELLLENNIHFLGFRSDSNEYINACDLFILPSIRDEDMPLVLLSALQLGKTILASNFAGISQVIQSGANGILMDTNNDFINQMRDKIFMLYQDREMCKLLGSEAKKSFEAYSPDFYGNSVIDLYKQLLTT